ncbi:hypothetical protein [Mumia sp. Pv 4-285]|uniref:hypothetical protein n=1 Tax=Mumia qirimensis TaxID=3234852 RepID=UPI00351D2C39
MTDLARYLVLPVALVLLAAGAYTAWRRPPNKPGADRLALLSATAQGIALLAVARSLVPWSELPAVVAYGAWGTCVALLAAGVAGVVVRWPELRILPDQHPRRSAVGSGLGIGVSVVAVALLV